MFIITVVFCSLIINRIINSSCLNIRDFLVKPTFTCLDFLNLENQVVKVILVKDLTIDQSVFIQDISLFRKIIPHPYRPRSNLCCPFRVDTILNSDNDRQGIEFILVCFSIIRNTIFPDFIYTRHSCRKYNFTKYILIGMKFIGKSSIYFLYNHLYRLKAVYPFQKTNGFSFYPRSKTSELLFSIYIELPQKQSLARTQVFLLVFAVNGS